MDTGRSPPQRGPLRRWLTVAWQLRTGLLAALLLLLLDLALRPLAFQANPKPTSTAALKAQAAEPGAAPVILLGSSRFRVLAEADLARGAGIPVRNLAFNGGSFDAMHTLSGRYLTDAVLKAGGTRLVVLGMGPMDLNDGYRNSVVVPDVWGWGHFFARILESGTDNDTRTFLFLQPPLAWSAIATTHRRQLMRVKLRDLVLGLLAGAPARPQAPAAPAADDPVANTQAQAAAGAESLAQVPQPVSSVYLRGWHVGGRQTQALRALVARLKAAGVAVALVHGPVSDWYAGVYRQGELAAYRAQMMALGAELNVPVFLLPKAAYGLVDADYFSAGRFDGHHLISPQGRVRLAQGIGAQVIAPVMAALDAGQPAGAALGRDALGPPGQGGAP
ncbi:MAG: hypothetical protein H6702_04635 [Myxococcales bacterium]|nr:hypothetical protein [Myxococcales bacterium]